MGEENSSIETSIIDKESRKEDRRSAKIGEYAKIAIERVESKSKDNAVSESKTSTIIVGTGI